MTLINLLVGGYSWEVANKFMHWGVIDDDVFDAFDHVWERCTFRYSRDRGGEGPCGCATCSMIWPSNNVEIE